MIPALKSDFRKLLTIRSTYILTTLAVLLITLLAFYFEGYRGNTGSAASTLQPTAYREIVSTVSGMTAFFFVSIIAILFMAHEYRYNTIMYTLTANARRSKVLLSKIIVMVSFGVLFGIAAVLLGLGLYSFGVSLRGASLPAQDFPLFAEFGRVAVYFAIYALFGLLLATLLRNIVAAIGTLFAFPIIIEPLSSMILKENAVYMPFAATDTIIGASLIQGSKLSSNEAILVAGSYVVVGWAIAWLLFLRRDAN